MNKAFITIRSILESKHRFTASRLPPFDLLSFELANLTLASLTWCEGESETEKEAELRTQGTRAGYGLNCKQRFWPTGLSPFDF